jgi:hypothetical protein
LVGHQYGCVCNKEVAKGEERMDHYDVRHNHGWHRPITLALAYLPVRFRLPGGALKGRYWWRTWQPTTA